MKTRRMRPQPELWLEGAKLSQALLSASVLGLYAMFVGDMLSKRDSIKPEEVSRSFLRVWP